MTDFLESGSFALSRDLKTDVGHRLKESAEVKSMQLQFHGNALEGSKEFAELLVGLKKQGVKISHEFSIKLDFPRTISRDKTLTIVEKMPKPVSGSMKVLLELNHTSAAASRSKS